jgi:uncharacterized membrane protein
MNADLQMSQFQAPARRVTARADGSSESASSKLVQSDASTDVDQVLQEWSKLTEAEQRTLRAVLQGETSVRNVNTVHADTLAPGQRVADTVANSLGTWRFIIFQTILLATWLVLNTLAWINHWDPYPFILLNLALSFQAAYAAPIMMSQNRQEDKDRIAAEENYHCNLRAQLDIAAVRARLDELAGRQWDTLLELQRQHQTLLKQIEAVTREGQRDPKTP